MPKEPVRWIYFDARGDENGWLVSIECETPAAPFMIKRVYYIYGTNPSVVRGNHAHKTLQQVMIPIVGKWEIKVTHKGMQEYENTVESDTYCFNSRLPGETIITGLYVGPMVWREIRCSRQSDVLLVLASDFYWPEDYIRDKREFLDAIKGGKA